jgi:tetratricopeptide (TPR) repeat protein
LFLLPNSAKFSEAGALFQAQKYTESLALYKKLLAQYPAQSAEIKFNMAQIYMAIDSNHAAMGLLLQVLEGGDKKTKSLAGTQLGTLFVHSGKKRDALPYFLQALETNPYNEIARYNYELLKKQLKDEPEEEAAPPQEEPEEENSTLNWKKKFDYYLPPDNSEGLPTLHQYDSIPMPQAMEMLEKMKQEEVRFLQQLRKSAKPDAKKSNISEW